MNIFLGITGASGSIYANQLVEEILKCEELQSLVLCKSKMGEKVYNHELSMDLTHEKLEITEDDNMFHSMASGTNAPKVAFIVPASANTVSKLNAGIQDTLILRVAAIMLKLKKPLIILIREMPYSGIMLKNMLELNNTGAHIVPASPHFYHNPQNIDELISSVTGYLMDIGEIKHEMKVRWNGSNE